MTSAPLATSQFMTTCQSLIPAIGNSSYSQLSQTIFECNKFSQFCHGRVEWGPEAASLLLLYWWINYCQYQLMNRFIITLIAVHLTILKSGWRLEAMEVMPTGGEGVWWIRQLSDLTDLIRVIWFSGWCKEPNSLYWFWNFLFVCLFSGCLV